MLLPPASKLSSLIGASWNPEILRNPDAALGSPSAPSFENPRRCHAGNQPARSGEVEQGPVDAVPSLMTAWHATKEKIHKERFFLQMRSKGSCFNGFFGTMLEIFGMMPELEVIAFPHVFSSAASRPLQNLQILQILQSFANIVRKEQMSERKEKRDRMERKGRKDMWNPAGSSGFDHVQSASWTSVCGVRTLLCKTWAAIEHILPL